MIAFYAFFLSFFAVAGICAIVAIICGCFKQERLPPPQPDERDSLAQFYRLIDSQEDYE